MSTLRSATSVAGFPRIGETRELKKVLEQYWSGGVVFDDVSKTASALRMRHWNYQKEAGIGYMSCNDFSLYDGMLDMIVALGAVPPRFASIENEIDRYFAMARGTDNAVAMEMTKWFNTNYHYIVPELSGSMRFSLNAEKIRCEYDEARTLGIDAKINIIGPLTFLALSKRTDGKDVFELLPRIMPLYIRLFDMLAESGRDVVVQCDEPVLVRDPDERLLDLLEPTYRTLCGVNRCIQIIVMTYFDHAKEAVKALRDVPLYGIGLDFVYGPENIEALEDLNGKMLFAGVVDGRNIWRNDYVKTLKLLDSIGKVIKKDRIVIGTSCSLLHVPFSLEYETRLDSEVKSWMCFAREKLTELVDLASLFSKTGGGDDSRHELEKNIAFITGRIKSEKTNSAVVIRNQGAVEDRDHNSTFTERIDLQKKRLDLPFLPTTTIGSFPQTDTIRKLRSDYKKGIVTDIEYNEGIRRYIDECIAIQEEIGLDVLVHGEPERNDMVEYFGERLSGFAFTDNGWVQSYGSRCVKPPVIFGDITRPHPITVDIIAYAQSRTKKTVKGMLTGPVTILNWSFVRNDIERSEVCRQIAMCIRDEVEDLQKEGIKIIQVDEAAFREGYPLRAKKIREYEKWAVAHFKLAVSSARRETQIHTHMCYSDFTGIVHTIEKMDADVITIETSRSGSKLLKVFDDHGYTNEIGPGVYDIHSPRIPPVKEIEDKIRQIIRVLDPSKLWINPDCGLKTRKWEEVKPSLVNMVIAAKKVRESL